MEFDTKENVVVMPEKAASDHGLAEIEPLETESLEGAVAASEGAVCAEVEEDYFAAAKPSTKEEAPIGSILSPTSVATKATSGEKGEHCCSEVMVPVWFATNRKTTEKGEYSATRDPDHNTYGRVDVELSIAQNHTPPKKTIDHLQAVKKSEDLFFQEIDERLGTFRELGCAPQVLIVLHTYKVGFMESLVAASHWQEDLNVAGATISYSWPSTGKKGSYVPDDAALERSEPEIMEFILKASALCGAENVHLLVEGTACHGLLRVLQRMATDQVELKLGQMFLIVPDIDRETFMDLAWLLPKYTTRTTIYVSNCDKGASKSVKRHGAPRAGMFEPYTIVDGVDTIAITGLETDDFMVEKRTRSYEVLTLYYDMYDLMKSNTPPSRRLHLAKQIDDGRTFWKLRKL